MKSKQTTQKEQTNVSSKLKIKAKRLLKSIMYIFIIIYIVLILTAIFLSDKLIFPAPAPSYEILKNSTQLKLSDGTKITVIKKLPLGEPQTVILYNHGNAVDLGMIDKNLQQIATYLNAEVIAYDYPGYGTSTGKASESSVCAAAEAVYNYTINEIKDKKKLIIWGRSIGGGPAIFLASKYPGHPLIIESAFLSAFRVVTHIAILPFDKFPNAKRISKIKAPILILHGKKDKIIPFFHGQTLYKLSKEPKNHLWIENAGHNNLRYEAPLKYWKTIKHFIQLLD